MITIQFNTRKYVELEVNYRGDSRCGRNGIQPAILPAPGDHQRDDPEGEGTMPRVSWTSDKRMDGVSVLVGLF